MAGKGGGQAPDLKTELLEKSEVFSFFQALRLLRYYSSSEEGDGKDRDFLREQVRIRPNLSLAHPAAEIDKIEETESGYNMTANFLGLYGESSPLPAFYTEELMQEANEGASGQREFIDVINYPLYLLFSKIWSKYRPHIKVIDEGDPKYLEILFSLIGLGIEQIREDVQGSYQLLKYIGLLTQFPKSAAALKRLLADAAEEPGIDIIPCVERKVSIPEDQRFYMGQSGNVLGDECYLGQMIMDRTRKFRVQVGPIEAKRFRHLLPGTFKYRKIVFIAQFYLIDPFEMDLELVLDEGEVRTARLGDVFWSQLGMDTWIFSGDYKNKVNAVFELR